VVQSLRPALPATSPLSYLPAVWRELAIVNDGHTIWGWRVADGGPAWTTGAADDEGAIYVSPAPRADLQLATAGVPRYAAIAADGRCYARMGLPIATAAAGELRRPETSIVCLDLAQGEGRLAWSASPEQVLEPPEWTFTGVPVVADERMFVPVRRATPQIELGVACLDAATGRRVWQRRICSALAQAPAAYHLVEQDHLAVGGEVVFYAGPAGMIAALEAETGIVRWAVSYAARDRTPAERSDPAQCGVCSLLCAHGSVYAAPPESDELLALDAGSGVVLWRRAAPGRIAELVDAVDGVLIAAGDQLWGLDAETGESAWPGAVGYSDPAGFGYGRPAVAAGRVYWTTREDLFVVDARSGRIVQRTRLPVSAGRSGGNVVVAGELLLLARPEQVDAFGPAVHEK
jgi:outer membrane protein assembly factor BamB